MFRACLRAQTSRLSRLLAEYEQTLASQEQRLRAKDELLQRHASLAAMIHNLSAGSFALGKQASTGQANIDRVQADATSSSVK